MTKRQEKAMEKQTSYCEKYRAIVRTLKGLGAWRDWLALYDISRLEEVCTAAQEAADEANAKRRAS